jgi:glycosyltransferase involved in cell wall biosynthesis
MPNRNDDVWVVVAAYREQGRLAATLARVLKEGYPNVVVVDDGSPDDTTEAALALPVWLLRHPINLGQGAALQTGIDFALERSAEVLVTFDADGQHDASEIKKLVEPIRREEFDIALGSRFLGIEGNVPFTRKLVLKGGVLFTRIFSHIRVTDTHNGFRAFSRATALKLQITQNRMAHASEILDRIREHRLRYVEVPVTIRYTEETLAKGQSSWNAIKIVMQLLMRKVVR